MANRTDSPGAAAIVARDADAFDRMTGTMGERMSPTGTVGEDERPREAHVPTYAFLIAALHANDPLTPPARHWLASTLETIAIGRDLGAPGSAFAVKGKHAHLGLFDKRVSSDHAVLRRRGGRWSIENHSQHGTLIDGEPIESAVPLEDGDVISVGRTFLVYREAQLRQPPRKTTLRADDKEFMELPLGLRTLSPALEEELATLPPIAAAKIPVVVIGESGSGKELIARALHGRSPRHDRTMVARNVATLPESLLDAELFGNVRNYPNPGMAERPGIIGEADGSTLFLDEVGELSESGQAHLLRVLDTDGEYQRLGDARARRADFRLVSATLCDLTAMVDAKRFRHDLWHRIKGHVVNTLPLRDRMEDLGLILRVLLTAPAADEAGGARPDQPVPVFTRRAAGALFAYSWPGNVRELVMEIKRTLAAAWSRDVHEIREDDWSRSLFDDADLPVVAQQPPLDDVHDLRNPATRTAKLRQLLDRYGGNVSAIARATGRHRQLLQRWLHKAGISRAR